ncbi:hypothetical protein HA050_01895 [Iodobacter sp. HSC-16F04]|uniref:Uncharacterized protein n=1 Tax=Iodobacter violaceini TaxID=3044271 RepID=A0ABX0KN70_9NEIS|nr:HAD domain-containing protein [Iodobacter violacea]NHQ84864.1 hypothetical protein [Iodobacter violacea]
MDPKSSIFIYLDFDGVLHQDGEPAIDENGRLCKNPNLFCWLDDLQHVLNDFEDVRIIVSSDWRRLFEDETLIRLLGNVGSRFSGVVECTNSERYVEILQDASNRKIIYWLAIDDHESIEVAAPSDERLIFCRPDKGIGELAKQEELKQKIRALQKKIQSP